MKILELTKTDPYWNLAAEDYILRRRSEECLLLWRNANTIVVGINQNTAGEIDPAFVAKHNVRVVRRRTGGGAVYHDLGNLNFSFITGLHQSQLEKEVAEQDLQAGESDCTMRRFTRPVVQVLRSLGLAAEANGRNDITVNGVKVSGNAQAIHKNRILHHGTLLFDANLSVLSRALLVKPEKFRSKGVSSVLSRVGNIREFLPQKLQEAKFSIEDLTQALISGLAGEQPELLRLTKEDLQAIDELCESKYRTWEWNYGQSPPFNFHNLQKYAGGFLEVMLDVAGGKIKNCRIYGDFMALRPIAAVEAALIGQSYRYEVLERVLEKLPLNEYFGGITLREILKSLF